MENYGGGPEIFFNINDDIYNAIVVLVDEDLFYSKIHRKPPNLNESENTAKEVIDESIITNNYESKYETKIDDIQFTNNIDFLQQTLLNSSINNDYEIGNNISKFDETLYSINFKLL